MNRTGTLRRPGAVGWALAALCGLTGLGWPAPSWAQEPRVVLTANVGGRDISLASEVRPVRIDPQADPLLDVSVTNRGREPVTVRTVRLQGGVLGMTLFAYDTAVGMEIAPGATAERTIPLDLHGLRGQATGLIPSALILLDEEREKIAAQPFVADVRGSLRSVYGAFGLAVAAFTAMSLADALSRLARHRLSHNRWRRAIRFAAPGVGAGLTMVFTLSALRVLAPTGPRWGPIVAGAGALGFILGYLTPTPEDEEAEGAFAPVSGDPVHEDEAAAAADPTGRETR